MSTPKITEPVAILQHTDAAEKWATSPERTVVFSVTREEPNPNLGMPLAEQPDDPSAPVAIDERETITTLVEYTMPAKPNAGLALAYLKRARENADLAMSWVIETAIGSEGYDALADELSGEDNPDEATRILQGVVERIQRVAMGGLDGQGNAPKA